MIEIDIAGEDLGQVQPAATTVHQMHPELPADIPDFEGAFDTLKRGKIKNYPQHNNRASSIGGYCERELVYCVTHWQHAAPTDLGLQYVFDEGNMHEAQFNREASEAGLEIIEQQGSFSDPETNTTGHQDGKVLGSAGGRYTFEFKSCSPHVFGSLSKYGPLDYMQAMADLAARGMHWLHKYPAQIQLYAAQNSLEWSVVVFKNKTTGRIKQFYVRTDLAYVQQIREKAKRIARIIADAKAYQAGGHELTPEYTDEHYPERIQERTTICKGCKFAHLCLPDIDFNEPIQIEEDPEFEAKLTRWSELKAAAAEYDKLNKAITEQCRGRANLLVGNFHVTGKKNAKGTWLKSITTIEDEKAAEAEGEPLL